MKRNRSISIVTIVALACLVLGTFSAVQECCKIAMTGAKLIVLNDNARFYNEQPRKTDDMTAEYNANEAKRQAIYNSEDTVIRVFSNLPTLTKLLAWILAIVAIPGIPCAVILHIVRRVNAIIQRRKTRRRKMQSNEARNLSKSSRERRIV